MSSTLIRAALLAVLAVSCLLAYDEDLSFDDSSDTELKYYPDPSTQWNSNKLTAVVGRYFRFTVPKKKFGENVHSFEVKQREGKFLPSWLLFDKTDGILWGVPLSDDTGTLHVTMKSVGTDKPISEEFEINIVEPDSYPEVMGKCPQDEDITILSLLIDRSVQAIKPKQRIVAINNIANFLGMPFSAFTFKPESEPDDITDSSVLLAGPGNLESRSSEATALLEVPVGCDGRLWLFTAPIVRELKQQARDGTISEVLRLPLVGWRVRTETKPIVRFKRQADDVYGSGDYDEYYDEYEYDDDEFDDTPTTAQATTSTTTTTTMSTTTTTTTTTMSPPPASSSTHHHRHHHGEKLNETAFSGVPVHRQTHSSSKVLNNDDDDDDDDNELLTSPLLPETEIPSTIPSMTSVSKAPIQSSTTPSTRFEDEDASPSRKVEVLSTAKLSSTTTVVPTTPPDLDYDIYRDYETDDYEEEDVESETVVPAVKTGAGEPHITDEDVETTTIEDEPLPKTTVRKVEQTTTESSPPTTKVESTLFFFDENEGEEEEKEETPVEPTTSTEPTTLPTEEFTTFTTVPTTTTFLPSPTTAPTTTSTTTTTTTTTTTEKPTTIDEEVTTEEKSTSTVKVTTLRHISTSPRTTTIAREVTETIEYDVKNFQPYIENRLQQMSVVAGKLFRFVIPKNTFKDFEDKYNLVIQVLDSNGLPLSEDSWLQYNYLTREAYGLPLEKDISKWKYIVRATDTGGKYCEDTLLIHVQQHKSQRAVNHEFSLQIRIEKHGEYPHYIDWCMQILRALGKIYKTDTSEIIVRNINYTSDDPVIFTWTNDSIPKNYCPSAEIKKLFKMLTANDMGDPSRELSLALAPEMRVKKVSYTGLGVCEIPRPAVPTPPKNYSPVIRNHIDIIKATVGELLIFRVPEDTFYDPEEIDSRLLNITLLTANRQPIPPGNWLQFDSKNREFYGIPWKNGTTEYQLVCFDRAGLSATDSLVVDVKYPPKMHYNVEFSMMIETPYHTFNNTDMQRKFVERLSQLFGDQNTSNIRLLPFKQRHSATVATWYNKSLTREDCPHDEITRLENLVKNNDRSIRARVHHIMEFNISLMQIIPHGKCKVHKIQPKPKLPPVPKIEDTYIPPDETFLPPGDGSSQSSSDEYLITFIVPAVIIAIMLFLASIAACILYRKRRSGKLNLEEDGRQSYGNKGIPVIFQEELEEKPETGTKAPVILKDEKPPLAPPEYSKSGSLKLNDDSEPYQPPPPFTRTQDNNRQSRPKPTPTYRKPPPYVPP